ncbi:MAG: radical SAM protein [Myxococcota bacterium]|jgi:radical SAM protein with 4Fe4S-binding SPASM domain|nr:radical SAM protein [Myxococcota bacterium]
MPPTWAEAPHYVLWEITLRCNLRCAHCQSGAGRARPDELSTAEALALCDALAALKVGGVCLLGGEPLVRPDWPELANRLISQGIPVGIFTNGWLLDEACADRLLQLGVVQVGLSLDGAAAVHDAGRGRPGAHLRALAALDRVAARAFPYRTVVTSVRRANLGELDGLADLLADRAPGFTWTINVASGHATTRLAREELLDEDGYRQVARFVARTRPRLAGRLDVVAADDLGYCSTLDARLRPAPWTGCPAGLTALGITSDGGVKGCLALPDAFGEGNVRQTPLGELWRDPRRFALNRAFHVGLLAGGCQGCPQGEVCRGGCRDLAASTTGSPYHHPWCLGRAERRGDRLER